LLSKKIFEQATLFTKFDDDIFTQLKITELTAFGSLRVYSVVTAWLLRGRTFAARSSGSHIFSSAHY
jgi:hypothetical protein